MRPIVIAHGAWHQPAHFDGLAALLREQGASVDVPDLGGLALPEATAALQHLVDGAAQPPVVLAHSAGGIAAVGVTGAASTVYLAAWVLDAGESPEALIGQATQEGGSGGGISLVPEPDGRLAVDPAAAREALFADCDDEVAERATALLRPEPASIFAVVPARASWHEADSTYVSGDDDRALPPSLVPRFAARCTRSVAWPTSHSPYLSRPDLVVDLLARQG